MISILLGIFGGGLIPFQTGINTRLRGRLGSPFYASFVSFTVGACFLAALLLTTQRGITLPFAEAAGQPWWIWVGGVLGVVYLTGNILLMPRLGGVQTLIFPVLGQVLAGLAIDHFGLFRSLSVPLTPLRAVGGALVLVGVLIVTLARSDAGRGGKGSAAGSGGFRLWLWRLFGVLIGVLITCQTAINGCLGSVLGSALRASLVSFVVGAGTLLILLILIRPKFHHKTAGEKSPFWMWFGGLFGASSVFLNAYLAPTIGTGLVMVLGQVGGLSCSLLIDQFGWFGAAKSRVNAVKILGILCMLGGTVCIRLL